MTALLLDTHIWLWYAEGIGERLRPASVKRLDAARNSGGLVVSAISIWEIGVLCGKGRIQLSMPLRDWVGKALGGAGMRFTPLDAAAAVESNLLPGNPRGDPADRLLIATARTQNLSLATHDKGILDYGNLGFVRVASI